MCVVKVNRVEGDSVRCSTKELLHSSSPVKTDPDPCSPGEVNRTADVPGQWSKASPLRPGATEDLPTSQDGSIRNPTPEDQTLQVVLHTAGPGGSDACSGPSASQTSRREDASSQTPNREDSVDAGPQNGPGAAEAGRGDAVCGPRRVTRCTTDALLRRLQPEPVGGGSSPSPHTLSPSTLDCSLEQNSSEENIFPPLLQMNSIDMPLLSPEPEEKPSICLLPPVLTQEMPSLTPAHDGIPTVSRLTSCSNQIAPVLQREVPTGSLSSHAARREDRRPDGVTSEHAGSWQLALLDNCEAAATSSSHGNTTSLTASVTHGAAPADVHDALSEPQSAAETPHTQIRGVCAEQGGVEPHRPVQDRTPPSEQDDGSTKLPAGPPVEVLRVSTAASLLHGASASNPSAASSLGAGGLSALQLHHPPTYSHCSSSHTYIEPKPFSSSIWRNLNSHSPAVLIQSLNPELSSDFSSSDPLPYTIWTEPQCKEVTDLESSERELHLSENQEEEGRPLTWAQLEPTSLVSVATVEPLGLCGDYELHRREAEGSEALSLCTELGRKMEEGEILQSGTVVSALVMGGGHQEEGSDLEEGASDAEEAEEHCNAREEESSDLTDEEGEEAFNHNYRCPDLALEPGEICAVSAHVCATELGLLLQLYKSN